MGLGSAQVLTCATGEDSKGADGGEATHTSVDLYIDYKNNEMSAVDKGYEIARI